MDVNTEIDIDDFQDALLQKLSDGFTDIKFAHSDELDRKRIPAPCGILDLFAFNPNQTEDPGTGQLAVIGQFELFIVFPFKKKGARRQCRKAACSIAAFLFDNKIPKTGRPEITGIEADETEPQFDEYEVWRVDFQIPIHLGETVWTNDGTIPTDVYIGWTPNIGIDHEEDYVRVTE